MDWAIPEHTSQVQRFMRHPGGNILLEIGVLKHFVEVSNLPGIPAGQIQVRVFELGLIEHPTPTLGGSGVPMADVIKHQRMFENSEFNGDISRWNTSRVQNMARILRAVETSHREISPVKG